MKRFFQLLASAVLATTAAQAQSSSRLAAEWHVPFATAPDRFALVDAASGTVRLATLDANAAVTWSSPISTGIAGVSDACAGLPGASGEILALTSSSANRVILIDALSPAPFPRIMPNLSGIGPSGVAPIGTAPNLELLVATRANGSSAGRLETHHNLSTTAALLANSPHTTAFRRLQPLTAPTGGPTLALVTGDSGVNTRIELAARNAGSHTLTLKATFTNAVDFAINVRSTDHPTRLFTIAYRSGATLTQLIEFTLPLTTASTITSNSFSLPFLPSAVIPVHNGGAGGNLQDGFLAIAADGSQALHLRVNAAGNGITPPVQTFTAEPGTLLTGIIPVPGIGIVKLASSTPGGPSDLYHTYQWNGSGWVLKDSGTLPALPAPGEILATLLFYNKDPMIDESARLIGARQLASWTRRISVLPVPSSVLTETFSSSSSGLTPAGNVDVLAPAGTNYVLTNQFDPDISIAAAGDLGGLMSPGLRIDPPSGTYHESFQVTAEYDETRFSLRVRQNGDNWQPAPPNLPVAWSTTLEFSLSSNLDGTLGPIVTRSYTLPAASLADIDSDNDGVPDYVELAFGLDPFGGADSDGDGVSDLDEILQGTDPGDPSSFPSPNLSAGVSPEGGIALVAAATASSGIEIALGEDLVAHRLDGSLIARAPVETLANPLPDGGTRGAILRSSSPQPLDGLVAVLTPVYFDLVGGARNGREIIAFFPATAPPPFEPAFTPSGTNLSVNVGGWIGAAQAAAANRPAAAARSLATPADAAAAILLEEIVHAALTSVRPVSEPPAALGDFSFLPARASDLRREFPSSDDRALLASAGFDFRAALDLSNSARTAMTATAVGIYQRHATASATTPGIALPIDALRLVLRGALLPAGYAGAVSAGNLTIAQGAYATALSQLAQAFRPTATWIVEILATPADPGIYLRTSDTTEVALLNPDGSRFRLERGLGLQPGARFTVNGFTDTPPAGSFPTMEITTAVLASRPAASDTDADGNLLDDEWEKFFFGATGQDPFSQPNGNGYSLLQYFLDGADPRGDTLPSGPPVSLAPQLPVIAPAGGGAFTLDFVFPSAYQDRFAFVLEKSTTLAAGSFNEVLETSITSLGADELRAAIPASAAPPGKCFYRIRIRLK